MDKFVLVIDNYKLYVFEMMDETNAEIFKIRGNEYDEIDLEDPEYTAERIKNYLLDTLNYNDFSNCNFNVIYNDVGINVINALMGSFSSASDFEVSKLENSLVSILLKSNKITTGETKVINFYDSSWEIELTEGGLPNIMETNNEYDIQLTVEDIPAALFSTYSFTTDKKEVNNLNTELEKTKEELEKTKKELQNIKEGYPKLKKQRVEESRLEERDGVKYIKGEDKPFSGYKIIYHENSEIIESEIPYKNGKKDGTQIDYYEDGTFENIINYKKGRENNGIVKFWNNGGIYESYHASNGKKHKGYVEFNEDNTVWHVTHYKNGVKHRSAIDFKLISDDHGFIGKVTTYKEGEKNGSYVEWGYLEGYINKIENFKKDKLNGSSIEFFEDEIDNLNYYNNDEYAKHSIMFDDGRITLLNDEDSEKEICYNDDGTVYAVS